MTNLIIHTEAISQINYLLEQINKLIGTEYRQVSQIYSNPDIHIIEDTAQALIGIDEVKKLQKEMVFKPFKYSYQIGVIFHAQNLTVEAQNALLKTLEEQSPQTIYYLLANNEQNLLETIVSRSIKHYVKRADLNLGQREQEDAANNSLENSPAESVEEPEILTLPFHEKFSYIDSLINEEKELPNRIQSFLDELAKYYRLQLKGAIREKNLTLTDQTRSHIESILTVQSRIKSNVNKKLSLENLILSICEID